MAYGGGLPAGFLSLERAFPANETVELEVLRARDRARHGRLLQGGVGGVVDFSVLGTSDPFLVGYHSHQNPQSLSFSFYLMLCNY